MGIFLFKHRTIESVVAKYEFSLINLHGKENRVEIYDGQQFEAADDQNWGSPTFIKRNELSDLGFLKDNTILFKAYVEVLES